MITKSNLTFVLWYTILQTSNEINPPLQKLLSGNNIFTLYFTPTTKTKLTKQAITWPKFCRWLPIWNLTCILQWYILLQTTNELNTSFQKLLSRIKKCDNYTDKNMVPMCLQCYTGDTRMTANYPTIDRLGCISSAASCPMLKFSEIFIIFYETSITTMQQGKAK